MSVEIPGEQGRKLHIPFQVIIRINMNRLDRSHQLLQLSCRSCACVDATLFESSHKNIEKKRRKMHLSDGDN